LQDEFETFGVVETVELKPGGANLTVTEENKAEFIRLLCEHRLKGRVEHQLNAFKKGLYEIVPEESLRIFDERELEVSNVRLGGRATRFYSADSDLFSVSS